jgi:dipeptidase E
MKLLLTSDGISNKSIEKALKELLGKKKIRTVFIPTAANTSGNDKGWLIDNYVAFQKLGFITIIDIAVMAKEKWLPILQKANVIVMGGGDTKYLMEQIKKSGLDKELPELLKKRVYVGISAGSIITNEDLWSSSEFLYGDELGKAPKGLNYINIHFRPHYRSPYFPKANEKNLRKISKKNPNKKLYAMDDDSALKIVNGKIEIISEGKWKVFPEK